MTRTAAGADAAPFAGLCSWALDTGVCAASRPNSMAMASEIDMESFFMGNLWRRLVLPTRIDRWSLTSLRAPYAPYNQEDGSDVDVQAAGDQKTCCSQLVRV